MRKSRAEINYAHRVSLEINPASAEMYCKIKFATANDCPEFAIECEAVGCVVGHISGVIISHHYNLQLTIYNGELQSNDKTLGPY